MDLSALDASTEICMTPEELQQALLSIYRSNASLAPSKESVLNNEQCQENSLLPFKLTIAQKVAKAREWLGDRYLCAVPQKPRVRK